MTATYRAGDRIEWNPTDDEWLPGAVLDTRGESIRIGLDEGDVMWVAVSNVHATLGDTDVIQTRDTHGCPGNCGRLVPKHHFACKNCWHRLPIHLRQEISDSHQRDFGAHMEAMITAQDWYIAQEVTP